MIVQQDGNPWHHELLVGSYLEGNFLGSLTKRDGLSFDMNGHYTGPLVTGFLEIT